VKGQYTLNSKQVDQFVWDHKDMVIVFAAGNEGVDSNNDGIVEDDSIDSPGSAKNCITVGASENNRPGIEGLCTGLFGILPENDLRNESDGGKGPLGNSVRGRMYFNGSTRKKKGLVKILQRMLNELGYKSDDGKLLVVDGVFGDKTEQAVMKFQNDNVDNDGNPLQIDGLVGPKTAGVLNRIFDKRLVILTYRRRISRFITNPLADDQIADNVEGLVAFSSRGPVDGNRIKPDIIAPGTSILATKSSRARDPVTDGVSSNPQYMFLSGTSMATPHIAGSAAIVRQYLKQLFSHDKDNKKWRKKARLQDPGPTAALIKAMLVHGAVKLKGQYDPAHNDSGGDVPNNHQGFGRVDLKQSLFPDAFMEIYDGHSLLKDEEREYRFLINSNKSEFKGTLVWTDLPNCNLVNKLELKVSDTNAQQRLSEQYNNNVQKFVIDKPNNGIYKVSVKCTNISSIAGNDGQDYALIVTGDITATLKAKSIDIMEYPKQKRLLDPVLLRNESDGGKGPLGNSVRGRMYFNGSTREKEDLVKILQIMLNELGYKSDDGKLLVVDGVFGDKTEQAVMKFQNDNKDWKGEQLKIDGLVGPLTSDALNRAMVGIWYPMYQTDSKLTNDIIVIAVTKDALNKEISLDLNKAKKIRLIMMDRQQVKAITLHEPDDSKFSFEGEGKYTIFDKDGTAIADGRIKDDENIILPKDFDFYAVELKVSNTIYTFYKD
jgi:peptidoglycan hydrolase-like protein with peptidoglycan-binding domain